MYIYIKMGDTYEVGYYLIKYNHSHEPYNQWYMESDHRTIREAAARVNYLNGGTGQPQQRLDPYSGWEPVRHYAHY